MLRSSTAISTWTLCAALVACGAETEDRAAPDGGVTLDGGASPPRGEERHPERAEPPRTPQLDVADDDIPAPNVAVPIAPLPVSVEATRPNVEVPSAAAPSRALDASSSEVVPVLSPRPSAEPEPSTPNDPEPVDPEPSEPEPSAPNEPEPSQPEPSAPNEPEPSQPEPGAPNEPEPTPQPQPTPQPEPVVEPIAEPEPRVSGEAPPKPPADETDPCVGVGQCSIVCQPGFVNPRDENGCLDSCSCIALNPVCESCDANEQCVQETSSSDTHFICAALVPSCASDEPCACFEAHGACEWNADGLCECPAPNAPCGGCADGTRCVYQTGSLLDLGAGYTCADESSCNGPQDCACIQHQGDCLFDPSRGVCSCDNGLLPPLLPLR